MTSFSIVEAQSGRTPILALPLRRIERLGSAAERARKALAQIEALVPEQAQQ
jgi:hypothetical protein